MDWFKKFMYLILGNNFELASVLIVQSVIFQHAHFGFSVRTIKVFFCPHICYILHLMKPLITKP